MKKIFRLTEAKDKEVADLIRVELKKLKLTPSDVSVKVQRGGYDYSVNVTIKTMKAYLLMGNIESISDSFEKIDRDERSYEILSGGNIFVLVNIDYKFSEMLLGKIQKQIEESNFPENDDVSLFNGIVRLAVNQRQELFVYFKTEDGKTRILKPIYNSGSLANFVDRRTRGLNKEQLYSTIASMISKEISSNTDIINFL